MRRTIDVLTLLLLMLLLSNCNGKENRTNDGTLIPFKYAQLIKLWDCGEYKKLEIKNPWDTASLLQTYLLVDKTQPTPKNLPKGVILRTPLEKSVVYTTVHCTLLQELDAVQAIAGICDLDFMQQKAIIEGCKNGTIVDLGNSMGPNKEKIIDLNPDGIFLSPFENSGGHGDLDKFGLPVFECADYMETEALGRSEWIRIYGLLFGKKEKADSIFNEVEKAFEQIQAQVQADSTNHHPTLLYGLRYGDTWYVPGGNSYMAKLFKTAGAQYLFADTPNSGAIPYSFETVYEKGYNADLWLFLYNGKEEMTYKEMDFYYQFKSFQEKEIYACNTSKTPYFDEIPFHPERLLIDLYQIIHQKDEDSLHYYKRLVE